MTAAERTLTALRADVLTGGLAPGEQLVQEDIADKYGVSRVPVREALQLLTSEGLVSHVPHRGYFVTELSISDLSEVYRLRQLLEAEAIRAAVPALRDDDVTTFEALAIAVQDADDLQDLTAANRRFHFALFEAAGMGRLTRLLRQLWDASDVYRSLYFQQSVNRSRVHAEHAEMLAAIRDRDTEHLIALHDAHRAHSVAWVRSQLLRQTRPEETP
ncbi:MAG: GntR family transcriptional regulator [Candidatus Nanopelagicales bacterium]